jgi:multicomponent K+:H+ antiporter subunit G
MSSNEAAAMSSTLPLGLQVLAAALLVIGGLFTLIGALGLLRFPDFFMRLHAPTKATTLGVGGVLLASVVLGWAQGEVGLPALLITGFLFITAPVSANLMAQAALHLGLASQAGPAPGTPAAAPAPGASPAPPSQVPPSG